MSDDHIYPRGLAEINTKVGPYGMQHSLDFDGQIVLSLEESEVLFATENAGPAREEQAMLRTIVSHLELRIDSLDPKPCPHAWSVGSIEFPCALEAGHEGKHRMEWE